MKLAMVVVETGDTGVDSQAYHQGHVLRNRGIMSVLHMALLEFILEVGAWVFFSYFLCITLHNISRKIITQYQYHWTKNMLQLPKQFYSSQNALSFSAIKNTPGYPIRKHLNEMTPTLQITFWV